MFVQFRPKLLLIAILLASSVVYSQNEETLVKSNPNKPIASRMFKDGETLIDEVKYIGFSADFFEEEDQYSPVREKAILETLAYEKVLIKPGDKLDKAKCEKVIEKTKSYLFEHGFFKAAVSAEGESLDSDRMNLVFKLEKGPRSSISAFKFNGTKNFSNDELSAVIKDCLGEKANGFYDKRHVDYCAQKQVRTHFFSKGFFEAKLVGPQTSHRENRLEVSFEVTDGRRFRLGEITIKGNKVISEKEILEGLKLKTGDVADAKAMQDFLYYGLKEMYSDKGYIQYNAEFEPTLIPPPVEGLDSTVDVQIEIDEGKQFKVALLEVYGASPSRNRELSRSFSLRAGDIYIPSKLQLDIEKLNKTGEFEFIDFDQDVEIGASDGKGDVTLRINIRKIEN